MLKKDSKYYTSIVLKTTSLISKEANAREVEIEIYEGGTSENDDKTYYKTLTVPLKGVDDFIKKGTKNIIVDRARLGRYYWFRARTIDINGKVGSWSKFIKKRAGDNENNLMFGTPVINNYDDQIVLSIPLSNVPTDIESYEIKISKVAINDVFDTTEPATPTTPAEDSPADIVLNANPIDDELKYIFPDPKDYWYYFWVRAIDTSGNIASNNLTNNWYYAGAGRKKPPDKLNLIIDDAFEIIGYDPINEINRLKYWYYEGEFGNEVGAKYGTYLQGLDGNAYPVYMGLKALLTDANTEILNKDYVLVEGDTGYKLKFKISYDANSDNDVNVNEKTMTIKVNEYDSNRAFIQTQTLISGKIQGYVSGATVWKSVEKDFQTNTATKFLELSILTECGYIYFDNFELEKRPKAESIIPGNLQSAFISMNGNAGTDKNNQNITESLSVPSQGKLTVYNRTFNTENGLITEFLSNPTNYILNLGSDYGDSPTFVETVDTDNYGKLTVYNRPLNFNNGLATGIGTQGHYEVNIGSNVNATNLKIITAVAFDDDNGDHYYKSRTLNISNGMITSISNESDWTLFETY